MSERTAAMGIIEASNNYKLEIGTVLAIGGAALAMLAPGGADTATAATYESNNFQKAALICETPAEAGVKPHVKGAVTVHDMLPGNHAIGKGWTLTAGPTGATLDGRSIAPKEVILSEGEFTTDTLAGTRRGSTIHEIDQEVTSLVAENAVLSVGSITTAPKPEGVRLEPPKEVDLNCETTPKETPGTGIEVTTPGKPVEVKAPVCPVDPVESATSIKLLGKNQKLKPGTIRGFMVSFKNEGSTESIDGSDYKIGTSSFARIALNGVSLTKNGLPEGVTLKDGGLSVNLKTIKANDTQNVRLQLRADNDVKGVRLNSFMFGQSKTRFDSNGEAKGGVEPCSKDSSEATQSFKITPKKVIVRTPVTG